MSEFQKKILQRLAEQESFLNYSDNDENETDSFDAGVPNFTSKSNSLSGGVHLNGQANIPFETWKQFFAQNEVFEDTQNNHFNTYFTPPKNIDSPLFIFHHGAGSSALTFSLLASTIVNIMEKEAKRKNQANINFQKECVAGVFAFDARGHGKTAFANKEFDYSLDSLTSDFEFVIDRLFKQNGWTKEYCPSIFLVGHSLGGSVLTNYMTEKRNKISIKGLVMLDIVEDTAVNALTSMISFLNKRPKLFPSYEEAIKWHINSHLILNQESAKISVPDLFKSTASGKIVWVTNLYATESYWKTWFKGLSAKFVAAPTSKLLILAGRDKLDKDLMIGQMQGKYQLVVFSDSGHFLQEDAPQKTALTLIDFWKRNDSNLLKELNLPKWGGQIHK